MIWLLFALSTVLFWGIYGFLLHKGSMGMADPAFGRIKAFFWVGIAYFLVAILAPAVYLMTSGAGWSMPGKGVWWSLLAGTAGAVGAFGVLLALNKGFPTLKGATPAVVMSIVFAGAPIVSALVTYWFTKPPAGWKVIDPLFYLGIVMAAAGGALVTLYKPQEKPAPPKAPLAQPAHSVPAATDSGAAGK